MMEDAESFFNKKVAGIFVKFGENRYFWEK